MSGPALNTLLPHRPLLDLTVVPGAELEAVADPFPVSHEGRLYVLAEVLGRRAGAGLFKKIGVFEVSDDLAAVQWLGEACPEDDGLCSFPFVLRDGDRYIMTPEVFVPMQGGGPPILQTLQIWVTEGRAFPFGWRKHHEGLLPGCAAPSDKVLVKQSAGWRLLCSDNAMQRLMAYECADLKAWRPIPGNPVVSRERTGAIGSPGNHPWRLGGGPLLADGVPALPLQHGHADSGYGGAVTLLSLPDGPVGRGGERLAPSPILAADPSREWMSRGAHHVAMVRHRGRNLVAVDGFDGRSWRSTVVDAAPVPALEPLP